MQPSKQGVGQPAAGNAMKKTLQLQRSSFLCDLCGTTEASFTCDQCNDKQLCAECNKTWHTHVSRKSHEPSPMAYNQSDDNILRRNGHSNQNGIGRSSRAVSQIVIPGKGWVFAISLDSLKYLVVTCKSSLSSFWNNCGRFVCFLNFMLVYGIYLWVSKSGTWKCTSLLLTHPWPGMVLVFKVSN